MRLKKLLFAPAALLFLGLLAAAPARADVIVVTLPEFNGPEVAAGFPRPPLTVDTFNFTIPAGQQIQSATIGGTFGNTRSPSTADVDLRGDLFGGSPFPFTALERAAAGRKLVRGRVGV